MAYNKLFNKLGRSDPSVGHKTIVHWFNGKSFFAAIPDNEQKRFRGGLKMSAGSEPVAVIRSHYLDASAIVKLLVNEEGSERLKSYSEDRTNFRTTTICFVEALGVLKVKHFYRNELDKEGYFCAAEILAGWTSQMGGLEIEEVNLSDRSVFYEVEQLCKKYALDLSDGLQLFTLKKGFFSPLLGDAAPILITADDALAEAAKSEGGRVWHVLKEAEPQSL